MIVNDLFKKAINNTPAWLFLTISVPILIITIASVIVSRGDLLTASLCEDPDDYFMDFFNSMMYSIDYPYTRWKVSYPPLITFIYYILGTITQHSLDNIEGDNLAFMMRESQMGMVLFLTITIVTCYGLVVLSRKMLSHQSKTVVLIVPLILSLSYPLLFALERGNCIYVTIVMCLIFAMYYDNDNKYLKYAAFTALGIAVSMKLTPIILGLLIIREKKWLDLLLFLIITINIFFITVIFLDFNIVNYLTSMVDLSSNHQSIYIISISSWLQHYEIGLTLGGYDVLPVIINIILLVSIATITITSKIIKKWELVTIITCYLVIGFGLGLPYMMGYLVIPALLFFYEERILCRFTVLITVLFMMVLMVIPCPSDLRILMVSLKSVAIFLLLALIIVNNCLLTIKTNKKIDRDTHPINNHN